jgi:hypothetical protein
MKRVFIMLLFFCLSIAFYQGNAEGGAAGIPDVTKAATLIVPLMEKGISSVHNTLTVVRNVCSGGERTVHWQVWDIDGNAISSLKGNEALSAGEMWVSDFGTILSGASGSTLTQLTQGSFYRGFMTIDLVTASTSLLPTDGAYPFSSNNCLFGFVYYVRLLEGAANGIDMIHIEGGVPFDEIFLQGFYQGSDDREEIDNHAGYCAHLMTRSAACASDPDNTFNFIGNRVYLAGNGESRILVWAWAPQVHPTTTSAFVANGSTPFPYTRSDESNAGLQFTTVQLNHIVNVIDVTGNENGWVWIQDIPGNFHVYSFSFNSANFSGNPAITWEAMFEALLIPEF